MGKVDDLKALFESCDISEQKTFFEHTSKKGKSESLVSKQILVTVGNRDDVTLWRNNCGQAYVGKFDRESNSIQFPKAIRYGVNNPGGSDLIGFVQVKITEDMIGGTLAVFLGVEIKREKGGVASPEQIEFIDFVNTSGGIAGIVNSVESAELLVNRYD